MRTAAEGYAISTDRTWWFLDTLVIEHQVAGDRNVFVFEQLLPEGASPPLHVHDVLDDSFFALEGKIVFRRGDEVFLAEPEDGCRCRAEHRTHFGLSADRPASCSCTTTRAFETCSTT